MPSGEQALHDQLRGLGQHQGRLLAQGLGEEQGRGQQEDDGGVNQHQSQMFARPPGQGREAVFQQIALTAQEADHGAAASRPGRGAGTRVPVGK
jgi:hypothetical protein